MRPELAVVTVSVPFFSMLEMNTLRPSVPSAVSLSMKNTRRPLEDSWNCPGAMRCRSPRLANRSRRSAVCWLAQGQMKKTMRLITSNTGQEKRITGPRNPARERPLENQMIISLSRYMRESVETIEMNKASVRMVWV
ncbi:hypothetical protein D9M68_866000 [compost metagenome]